MRSLTACSTHLQSQRALAVFLVGSAALLATVLTNDIALFIPVLMTVALQRLADGAHLAVGNL